MLYLTDTAAAFFLIFTDTAAALDFHIFKPIWKLEGGILRAAKFTAVTSNNMESLTTQDVSKLLRENHVPEEVVGVLESEFYIIYLCSKHIAVV